MLWCLSTGGKCPADALAIAQGVADFITMAALCHYRSCVSWQGLKYNLGTDQIYHRAFDALSFSSEQEIGISGFTSKQ